MIDETVVGTTEPIKKVVSMGDRRYDTQKTIEDEEKELEELIQEQKEETELAEKKDKLLEAELAEPDSAEEKTFKKRYGDLRRHTQKQQKEHEDKIIALQEQLDKATKSQIKLPKSEKELEIWSRDYPDVAAIIETIAIKKSKEQSKDLEKKLDEINKLQSSAKREKAEVELLTIHPDFEQIREQEDFHKWAEEQPKWIQDALYENETDAHSAARAIDLYKVDRELEQSPKPTKNKRTVAKDAARAINTKTSNAAPELSKNNGKWKESTVEQMSSEQYEKNADSIMEAIRAGEFIYDISGSAR
jgi:hypothetical protein|tara:strand:+ start:226 stop:1134 length:909 start_codon:yes stop_codon:yes gene_type:complete